MFNPVTLPFWLAAILGLFAVIGLVDRIFAPGVRWYFRRRVNRAIDELNNRLQLRIQPFKLTRRQTLIDQLLYDPEVIKAVEKDAETHDIPRQLAMKKAARYAGEIVPSFSAYTYFKIGARLSRALSTWVYRVRLGYSDDANLQEIDPEATVIFVMNHRSNMDYVLVTYMASTSATLSYAVGEWARIWLLQNVIRSMGAYFIRRASGNDLYRRVLARYVHMATRSGVTQAVFPEGGLTRDGKLREPKLGLVSYMVSDFDAQAHRDVVFVPVGLNYDRVIEDRVLTSSKHGEPGEKTFKVSLKSIFSFTVSNISKRLKGQLYRYGYACVSFGKPLSLKDWVNDRDVSFRQLDDAKRFELVEELGETLITRIGDVVPVLPVSLAATVFLNADAKPISELELKSRAFALIARLEAKGAHIHIPRKDRDYAITTGLRMLTLRHLVNEENGLYTAAANETVLLQYYANSIAHFDA